MQGYIKADGQLHLLCQIIAKVNRSFVPSKADDSHTNLFFDAIGNRIVGRWINAGNEKILLVLNLETQCIEILNGRQKPIVSVATVGQYIREIEQEIEKVLPSLGLNSIDFREIASFHIPDYEFANSRVNKISSSDIDAWKHFREIANSSCLKILGYTQIWAEIRIWPHNFDTGTFITLSKRLSIGFGFAIKDKLVDSPYFYLADKSKQKEIIYENLPNSEYWKWEVNGNWKGVVLPMDKLATLDTAKQQSIISQYIFQNTKWFSSHVK